MPSLDFPLPELSPSSLISSPGAPPDTPFAFDTLSRSPTDPGRQSPQSAGSRRSSVEMGKAVTAPMMDRRRGSSPRIEGRRTSLAPRPGLSVNPLPSHPPTLQFSNFAFPNPDPALPATPPISYPGEPSLANITSPAPFRFGSMDLSFSDDPPLLGTPTAELGPFEYPVDEGEMIASVSASRRSSTTGQIPLLPSSRRPSVIHSATATGMTSTASFGPSSLTGFAQSASARRRPSLLLASLQGAKEGPIPPSLLDMSRRGSLPVSSLFPLPNNPNPAPHLSTSSNRQPSSSRPAENTVSAAYLYNRRSSLVSGSIMASPLLSMPTESSTLRDLDEAPPSPTISSSGSFSSHATLTGGLQRSRSGSRDAANIPALMQPSPSAGGGARRMSLPFLATDTAGPSILENYRKARLASQESGVGERERRLSGAGAGVGGVEFRRLSGAELERRRSLANGGEVENGDGLPGGKRASESRVGMSISPSSPLNGRMGLQRVGSPLLVNRTGRIDSFGTNRSSLSSSSSGSRQSVGSVPTDSAVSSNSASSSEGEPQHTPSRRHRTSSDSIVQSRLQERRRSSRVSAVTGRGSLVTIPDGVDISDFRHTGSGSDSDQNAQQSVGSSSEGDVEEDEVPSGMVFGGFSFPPKGDGAAFASTRPTLETILSDGGTPQGSASSTATLKAEVVARETA